MKKILKRLGIGIGVIFVFLILVGIFAPQPTAKSNGSNEKNTASKAFSDSMKEAENNVTGNVDVKAKTPTPQTTNSSVSSNDNQIKTEVNSSNTVKNVSTSVADKSSTTTIKKSTNNAKETSVIPETSKEDKQYNDSNVVSGTKATVKTLGTGKHKVDLHSEANGNANTEIEKLSGGTAVTILKSGTYDYVELSDGQKGYIYNEYLN